MATRGAEPTERAGETKRGSGIPGLSTSDLKSSKSPTHNKLTRNLHTFCLSYYLFTIYLFLTIELLHWVARNPCRAQEN